MKYYISTNYVHSTMLNIKIWKLRTRDGQNLLVNTWLYGNVFFGNTKDTAVKKSF